MFTLAKNFAMLVTNIVTIQVKCNVIYKVIQRQTT